jgi:pimeloyl-ACP methyl ester carboxylesterase
VPDGAVCREDGRCVGEDGVVQPLRNWPILPMPMASGAAFLELEKIANTRDHFRQAEVDLASLARSLKEADWRPVFGAPVDTGRIHYAGQSLGGILGATFTALEPVVQDAVLNVPGADTVDMFRDSPFFGGQIEAFFKREGVEDASFEGHRFMNVARWIMDACDPASFAGRLLDRPGGPGPRRVLLQMATLDFIIPNDYTRVLEELSGAPRRDYLAEHGFLVIPVEPEYLRGSADLAKFLTGELEP